MVLRIKSLSVDDVVGMLFEAAHLPTFQATKEFEKKINDLALACKVQARIAQFAPSISVTANDGIIFFNQTEGKMSLKDDLLVELKSIVTEGRRSRKNYYQYLSSL